MIYDYKHRKIEYESPMEKAEYEQHMSQFGPGMGKSIQMIVQDVRQRLADIPWHYL